MKTAGTILTLAALAVAGALAAEEEVAQPTLMLTASNFAARTGATLTGDALQLAPTGAVACTLAFATNQTCTIVVVARAAAEAHLAVRLDTNTIATAALTSTNWISHSFAVAVRPGEHQLGLAPQGATNAVEICSVLLIGAPLPQPVPARRAARPAWDQPVGR